jgi:S-adenosylmethionine/arginine decarboxylase-like enzyme
MRFTEQDILLDNEKIQNIFLDSLISANLTILDVYQHNYHPYGFSAIDIFICDEFSKGLEVIKLLKEHLKPIKSEFFFAERGKETVTKYESISIE